MTTNTTKPQPTTKICERLCKSKRPFRCECGGVLHERDSEKGKQLMALLESKKKANSGSHGTFGNKPKRRRVVNPNGEPENVAVI